MACGNRVAVNVATNVVRIAEAGALAGRGARLVAVILDTAIFVVVVIIAVVLLFISPWLSLVIGAGFLIMETVMLAKDGQTLRKKALRIRIVKKDTGQNGGFVTNVLLRFVLNGILGLIPFYSLVDILFIFGPDRRCLHDMIAGTKVVDA
jgi:uncharacterized RDD family membrane protein YckC